jgi:hypothetical protein
MAAEFNCLYCRWHAAVKLITLTSASLTVTLRAACGTAIGLHNYVLRKVRLLVSYAKRYYQTSLYN